MIRRVTGQRGMNSHPADWYQDMNNRRSFLVQSGAVAVATGTAFSNPGSLLADDQPTAKTPWLKKTLKIGMVKHKGSLTEKFQIAKDCGFAGIELNAPGFSIEDAKKAVQETGLPVDGTVGGNHWKVRHTDPDPQVRQQALKSLRDGIAATRAVGGDTMLLVAGHGKDGSPAEVYERAMANIRQALPDAEKHDVKIVIENVWNHFLYDHEGDSNQTADALASFVDAFESPLVGVQFDIGNHWKYGDPADWIRTLGDRILKLDIKGFSRKAGKFTNITEGDIHWASVREGLRDIKFTGWVAAEVGGGDAARLKQVAANMETALHCSKSL